MSIPISQVVSILPGVIGAGGAPSRLSGLVLSEDASIAPGQVLSFFTAADVSDWFGTSSNEATIANNYFPGILNGGQLPFELLFARFAETATPAGVYGVQLTGVTLATLQSFSGTLIVTVNSTLYTSSNIDLSTATSFANAATIMQAGFTAPPFTISYDATRNRFTLLTNSTGPTQTSSAVTGTLATDVGLSAATGATLQAIGLAADSPAVAMARVITITTNWGVFTTAEAASIDDRLAYAEWNSGQIFQYAYLGWDTDLASTVANNPVSFGAQVNDTPYQGTWPVYGTQELAGALMGAVASVNFTVPNGRTTMAFRQFNSGPAATVTDLAVANALLSNGYTYLGSYANAANNYTITYDGKISGAFLWVDTYIDQIYLNRELQRAFFEAMLAYNSIPYNAEGYTALYRAGVDVIDAAVISGIIRAGVTLSQSQQQQINTQAGGRDIAPVVQTRGWYLLIGDPANVAQVRAARTSPTAFLWYSDGGSIHQLTVRSIAVI